MTTPTSLPATHSSVLSSAFSPQSGSITRCLQIARECLQGDPFRSVPDLELETDRLAMTLQGVELTPDAVREAADMHLPAYQVAANALHLFEELASKDG